MPNPDKYELISELARRRGFFWPSYEIYGGVSGFLTYGPLGSKLKLKLVQKFRDFFIRPLNLMEIESSIVTPAQVFEASGHVNAFKEPLAECLKCKRKFRVDHLLQEQAHMSDTETEKLNLEEMGAEIGKRHVRCPECNSTLSKPRYFLTMFATTIGPYSDSVGYGRPEAAQGVFVEFKRLYDSARGKLPLGVVQIGHALRNEISPRQGPIRLREFTIADIEFFFDPEEPDCPFLKAVECDSLCLVPRALKEQGAPESIRVTVGEAVKKGYIETQWQAYFMALAKRFLTELGVPDERQRFVEKLEWERAHYSAQGYDQEIILNRWKWIEVSGHNYRTDYDLKQHMNHSKVDMRVFKGQAKPNESEEVVIQPVLSKIGPAFRKDTSKVLALIEKAPPRDVDKALKEEGYYTAGQFRILPEHVRIVREAAEKRGRRFIPHVVEPSFGIDRLIYAVLEYAYTERRNRTLLRLPRELAPTQVNVHPLVRKAGLTEKAKQLHETLINEGFDAEYDEAGSIGRRYARADEVGTPLCLTVDHRTLNDNTVTIRDRDSWKQMRADIESLPENLRRFFSYKKNFGEIVESPESERTTAS